jgi:hypothetical protein
MECDRYLTKPYKMEKKIYDIGDLTLFVPPYEEGERRAYVAVILGVQVARDLSSRLYKICYAGSDNRYRTITTAYRFLKTTTENE